MKLNGQQRTILREGILGAYPTEDELKIILLEKMDLNLEEFNRGETYNTKISNLIIQLEADGKLKDCIRIIVKEKPNSPDLEKVKSEFKTAIEDDNQISLGITRQSLIKVWISEGLDRSTVAKT